MRDIPSLGPAPSPASEAPTSAFQQSTQNLFGPGVMSNSQLAGVTGETANVTFKDVWGAMEEMGVEKDVGSKEQVDVVRFAMESVKSMSELANFLVRMFSSARGMDLDPTRLSGLHTLVRAQERFGA